MLPKQKRLSHAEFSRFFVSGKRRNLACGQVIYIPHSEFKAAVVVGKKVYKKAVDRNRLRRQLYHIIRDCVSGGEPNMVVIFIAKPAIRDLSPSDLKAELCAALQKLA